MGLVQSRQGKQALLFLKKKKQKKLLRLQTVRLKTPMAQNSKSFLVTFFQKSNFFLLTSLKAIKL
jgi:hypothetical protein